MKRTNLGLVPSLLVATLAIGCGDDGPATTSMSTDTEESGGDGDGDTGDGDGDTGDGDGDDNGDGDGDGDGDAGDGDGDGGGPDMDMDGVSDGADNCPDIANPNQLDYDDNGVGNVCDTQVFTGVTGTLDTTATAAVQGTMFNCEIPLMVMVTGGQILVQLDDDAAMAGFEIANLQIADIPEQECNLSIANASVSMTNFMMTNSGGPFPVNMPHSQAMHDAGQIAGESNMEHPVLSTATMSASVNGGEPMDSELMLDGAVPTFTANIMNGGASGTISFADPNFVLAMDQFMVDAGIPVTINFDLTGLVGTLNLAP
jgi:hypothetical protein